MSSRPSSRPTRRAALALLAALPAHTAFAQASKDDDAGLRRLLADFEPGDLKPGAGLVGDVPPILFGLLKPGAIRRRVLTHLLTKEHDAALKLRWPEDEQALDYAHLAEDGKAENSAFDVTPALISAWAHSSNIALDHRRPILLAIRGATITAQKTGGLRIAPTRPDLKQLRCVIGVWSADTDAIRGFRASTTPSALHTYAQTRLKNAGRVSSLLPTGAFSLARGTLRTETAGPHGSALRLATPVAALRDYGRTAPIVYAAGGGAWMLDGAPLAHGVHAAGFDQAPYRGHSYFSSSGSLTVGGAAPPMAQPKGDWAALMRMLAAGGGADQTHQCLLVTAEELRRTALAPNEPTLRRLRLGASGPTVAALQRALGRTENGLFDAQTQIAVLRKQLWSDDRADGVVTPRWARDRLRLAL
ncbi:MAG: hypothetical protein MRY74_02855 [Neomegalonema sp.]|nr:hypothetical protein [Neomegalonema sp.]